MAQLYADENFPAATVAALRGLGHDVLTAQQAGQAGRMVPDPDVLAYAISLGRAVLTHNRRHFVKLHRQSSLHSGIIICTNDKDFTGLAQRVHQAIALQGVLDGKLVRVTKPPKP
jgi:hypothetical protein